MISSGFSTKDEPWNGCRKTGMYTGENYLTEMLNKYDKNVGWSSSSRTDSGGWWALSASLPHVLLAAARHADPVSYIIIKVPPSPP